MKNTPTTAPVGTLPYRYRYRYPGTTGIPWSPLWEDSASKDPDHYIGTGNPYWVPGTPPLHRAGQWPPGSPTGGASKAGLSLAASRPVAPLSGGITVPRTWRCVRRPLTGGGPMPSGGRRSGASRRKKAKPRGGRAIADASPRNFVPGAAPGCHIAHGKSSEWLVGSEALDADDYDDDVEFPDIAVDPATNQLSAVNGMGCHRVVRSVMGRRYTIRQGRKAKATTWRGPSTSAEHCVGGGG